MVSLFNNDKINFSTYICLANSGQAHLVISILTDSNGFWAHENRDILINDLSDDMQADEV